uniref:hypothetical protein n=1 Tax=Alkalicoccobacillus gibsonii TaxID=79881 RepID=UPI001AEE55BA
MFEHAGGLVLSSFRLVKGPKFLVLTLFFVKQKNLPSKDERFLISARQRSTLAGGSPQLPLTQKSLTAVFG